MCSTANVLAGSDTVQSSVLECIRSNPKEHSRFQAQTPVGTDDQTDCSLASVTSMTSVEDDVPRRRIVPGTCGDPL